MLTSDQLILVELHKPGSSRVKKLLGDIVGGEASGKRPGYADELVATGKPIVGYLCNPLTWYLSQWQQGCAGKGDIHKRLTDQARWDQLHSRRATRPVKDNSRAGAMDIPEGWNADHAKSAWYGNAEDAEAFRAWLKAVLATKSIRRLVDGGFAGSPISKVAGLMTYQLFASFVRGGENVDKSIDTIEALEALGAANAITRHFIRAESIGTDLHQVLSTLGIKVTREQQAEIDGLKERGPSDAKEIQRFYDVPSLRMVAKRDELISKLFGYTSPATVPEDRPFGQKPGKDKSPGKKAGGGDEGAKLSKAEKEEKRQAREQRQQAKAGKAAAGGASDVKAAKQVKKPKPARAQAKIKPANATAAAKPKADKVANKAGKAARGVQGANGTKAGKAARPAVDEDDE